MNSREQSHKEGATTIISQPLATSHLLVFSEKSPASLSARLTVAEQSLRATHRIPEFSRQLANTYTPVVPGYVCALIVQSDEDRNSLFSQLTLAKSKIQDGSQYISHKQGIYFSGLIKRAVVAWLFPGQGSQQVGMLGTIRRVFPDSEEMWQRASGELQDELPKPLSQFVYPEGDDEQETHQVALTQTSIAQPALGVASIVVTKFLQALNVPMNFACGHSYGELSALSAAGSIDFRDLVRISRERGLAMTEAVADSSGGMLAISANRTAVEAILSKSKSSNEAVIANINSVNQTTIAGRDGDIEEIAFLCKEDGIGSRKLRVSAPFHSPLMQPAQKRFAERLRAFEFKTPKIPVLSNIDTQPYDKLTDISRKLTDHVTSPVDFVGTIQALEEMGVNTFVEVGPGNVTTSLAKASSSNSQALFITPASEKDGFRGLLTAIAQLAIGGIELDLSVLFSEVSMEATKRPVSSDLESLLASHEKLMTQMLEVHREVMLAYLGSPISLTENPDHERNDRPEGQKELLEVVNEPVGNADELPALVIHVISEKTGYPINMLNEESRLEDELAIDSIKLLEIFTALLELPQLQHFAGDATVEELVLGSTTIQEICNQLSNQDVSVIESDQKDKNTEAVCLESISQCTGYEHSDLSPDLSFEDDLAIDSIKKVEILQKIQDEIQELLVSEDQHAELMASESIADLIELVDNFFQEPDDSVFAQEKKLTRSIPEYRVTLPSESKRMQPPANLIFLATETKSQQTTAQQIAQQIEAPFLVVNPCSTEFSQIMADHFSKTPDQFSKIINCVNHNQGLAAAGNLWLDIAHATHAFKSQIQQIIHLNPIGSNRNKEVPNQFNTAAGFLKSLSKEWSTTGFQVISYTENIPLKSVIERLIECIKAKGDSEIWLTTDGLKQRHLVPTHIETTTPSINLNNEDHLVCFGAARGITASTTLALMDKIPCKVTVVGSTVLEDIDQFGKFESESDLRDHFITEMNDAAPSAIEARVNSILKQREIHANLKRFSDTCSSAQYLTADSKNRKQLETVLQRAESSFGNITGIIHGAGIVEDKLIQDKSPQSFSRVVSTKTALLPVLDHLLDSTHLKLVALFSSTAAVHGSRGQCDYALANEMLNTWAQSRNEHTDCRIVAICWGPWEGAGMVNPILAREFERRGVGLIPPSIGNAAFVNEICYGSPECAEVVLEMC